MAGHCRAAARPSRPSLLGPGEFSPRACSRSTKILSRPFDRDVPMGCTGDRVWASSPQGWAFRDDVHWLYLTNLRAFDLEIRDEHGLLEPAKATYFPSHIHYEGAAREEMKAAASFTFALDRVENPLSAPFVPEKRWTCWSSGNRSDWFEVDFGVPRKISGFDLFFFDDAPSGECRPPASFEVQVFQDQLPRLEPDHPDRGPFPSGPGPGENRIRFEPVVATPVSLPVPACGRSLLHRALRPATDPRRAASPRRPKRARCKSPATSSSRIPTSWSRSCECITRRTRSRRSTSIRRSTWELRSTYWDVKTSSGLIVRDDGEISGREPRSLSLDGRKTLLRAVRWPSVSGMRSWTILRARSKLPERARGERPSFGGFARPLLDNRVVALSALRPSHPAREDQGLQGGTRNPARE